MTVRKSTIQAKFIEFLLEQAKEKDLSMNQLADKAGISRSYLSHVKKYRNNIPSDDKLIKIAEALGINPKRMLVEAGRAPADDEEMVGLMRAFGELDKEDRRQVMQIVERYRKTGS